MKEQLCTEQQIKKGWYPAQCNKCGWKGCSCELNGGMQIADTGDYGDIYCPCCYSNYIDEADNEALLIDQSIKRDTLLYLHYTNKKHESK